MSTMISERIDEADVQLDLEVRAVAERHAPAPTLLPGVNALTSPQGNAAPASERPDPRSRVLNGLLRMADSYRQSGSLRQALEMYFELAQEHAETPQADAAFDRLLEIARAYEQSGELRAARSIYEQLL